MQSTPAASWRLAVTYLVTLWCGLGCGVRGLRELEVAVPAAALRGESVVLECSWRLEEEEALYSVKWYRAREEFYRYIPKELPHTRVFPQPGIEVDISRSGARRVVLQHVSTETAGRYRCEVSADAPTFHTEIRSAHLDIVDPPTSPPQLTSDRSWYEAGAVLRATCASPPAHPPANITWLINGLEVEADSASHEPPSGFVWRPTARPEPGSPPPPPTPPSERDADADAELQYLDADYVEQHRDQIRRKPKQSIAEPFARTGPDNRLPTFSELTFPVTPASFSRGVLRLTCVATVYNLHAARAELSFDAEQPEVASVLGVRNCAAGGLWRSPVVAVAVAVASCSAVAAYVCSTCAVHAR